MRHLKGVKQLGRLQSHRKAMFANMLTSLFTHERIVTTKQKGRELIRFSDRLISRAKGCVDLPEQDAKKVHNKRIVLKTIRKREVMSKLFDDIAPRYKERNGGYTKLYLLGRRRGDAAEMALVELVERRVVEAKVDKADAKGKKDKKDKKEKDKDKVKDKAKGKDKDE
ncbi:MAG TPA: 50S ribosomal protein L17 [Spirochaetota bacterium]|nr:50S ribosomal protein L17 [Spirochaetota bacterium]HNT11260.1 50S ribosomal protein L17 [Spirochaetota bacterium]